jgi:hypothetical protein
MMSIQEYLHLIYPIPPSDVALSWLVVVSANRDIDPKMDTAKIDTDLSVSHCNLRQSSVG